MTDMATTETEVKRKHPAAKCEVCPLYKHGVAHSQFPTGEARAAIVSRSPGFHDTVADAPFAGPSGQVLDHLLRQNGVTREEVLITNVVLCSPSEGKVPAEAIEACAPRLRQELSDISLVVAAGSEAVNQLVGRGSIDRYRGYRIIRGSRTLVATNNPALVLRDDSTFPNLVKDFKRAFNPLPEPKLPQVSLIEDGQVARKWISSQIERTGLVSADIESRGGLSHRATLVSIQFSFDGRTSIVLGERSGLFEDSDFIDNYLRPFLVSRDGSYVWHNGIFDTKILRSTYGIDAVVDEDTLLLSYAVDERGGVHELEYLLMEEFGWPNYAPASVHSFKKTGKLVSDAEVKKLHKDYGYGEAFDEAYKRVENRNYIALYKYAGHDAAGTFQLFELLRQRSIDEGTFEKPYKESLLAVEETLKDMELTGMPYDYHKAAEILEKEVDPELETIKDQLRSLTGKELLNPASNQQMSALYHDDWGIMHEMMSRPDKSRSVDVSARKEIIEGRFVFKGKTVYKKIGDLVVVEEAPDAMVRQQEIIEVAKAHDRFSKLSKQANTYLTALIKRAENDPESRIYTTLPRHATATGRLASREPNLQNVTRTKEGLPDIRGLFYAPDGFLLASADYSQAELRAIAALSGDPLLSGIYERGESLHKLTATRFYGEDYTYEQYSNSKNMNFGMFYRQSPETFLEKHEIPVEEARKYIEWAWSTFVDVGTWEKSIEELVHKNTYRDYSYVESPFGHRRRFYLITDENRNAVYREAINFLPQNIAALLTLHACVAIREEVDREQARLCLTVHDSVLAFVREGYVDEYSAICNDVMVSRPKELLGWTLPFEAEIGVGTTWANAK